MSKNSSVVPTYVVGVTGGIGSGKTTVCNEFADAFAVPVIDADIVAREVVQPGQPSLEELCELFGRNILDENGELNRPALKKIVFASERKRKLLEGVLHPRIRDSMTFQLQQISSAYCLLCIPLLAEGGCNPLTQRVLVVDCAESLQITRVTSRDGLTESDAKTIMATQATRDARRAIADDVITNDGNAADLKMQVSELHNKYMQLAQQAKLGSASR
jgi:dephospho-CoA kinase